MYVKSVGENYIQRYFELFNGQKKTSHQLFYYFFTGSIIFLMGNIVKFVRVGVRLFFGDESGFSSGYLEFEVLFLFMHARFVYHRHFFCFFDGHFFDFTWENTF